MKQLAPFFSSAEPNMSDNSDQKTLIDLWSKIEKRQKRNQNFVVKKEQLFKQFEEMVLPSEQAHGQQTFELVEFLVTFLVRKSLSNNQREELLYWIEEKLNYIRTHPFLGKFDHEALQKKVNDALVMFSQSQNLEIDAHDIERVRAEIELMFDDNMHLSDEEITNLMRDPSLLNEFIEQMNDALDEKEAAANNEYEQHHDPFQDFSGHQNEEEYFQQHTSQDPRQKDLNKLFKSGQLNKIYKKLAAILHPDKEQDPAKKQEKHILMQELSAARKNKDAYTLLQLYQMHINDGEFSADAETLQSIQTLLEEKLYQLDDELIAAKSDNDMVTLVWRKFSARSKKLTEQGFKQHIAELEEDYYQQSILMKQNSSVAKMKKTLQQRIEDNRVWDGSNTMDFLDMTNIVPPF
jgi:hypothetical protein